MVENGIPETIAFGNPKSYIAIISASSLASPRCTISRSSLILLTSVLKCGLISMHRSLACCDIEHNNAWVTPPVPGPNSMMKLAERGSEASTIRRSKKRELGIIDPIWRGCFKNSRMKSRRPISLNLFDFIWISSCFHDLTRRQSISFYLSNENSIWNITLTTVFSGN